MSKKRAEHWYKITREVCQVCGDGSEYRERVQGKKPKSWKATHKLVVIYCGCVGI